MHQSWRFHWSNQVKEEGEDEDYIEAFHLEMTWVKTIKLYNCTTVKLLKIRLKLYSQRWDWSVEVGAKIGALKSKLRDGSKSKFTSRLLWWSWEEHQSQRWDWTIQVEDEIEASTHLYCLTLVIGSKLARVKGLLSQKSLWLLLQKGQESSVE